MSLFPIPRSIEPNGQLWTAPELIPIRLEFAPSDQFLRSLKRFPVVRSDASDAACLQVGSEPLPSQGYCLEIKESGLTLAASDEAGLYYGLVTLIQIVTTERPRIHGRRIEDWPDLGTRGYMLDISRCKVPTMETLYQLIDQLAALKANQLQLYTEHVFAYARHEAVWADASPLTGEEIEALDQYCSERYIELVPNQNSFGHMERWLRHPDYRHLAECPNGFDHPLRGWLNQGTTLKPNDQSIAFLDTLYDELLPRFRSRQFNIGGDEPWELGQGWSGPLVESHGKHRVYLDFLKKIHRSVSFRGYVMQYWGDIVLEQPDLAAELPHEVISLVWGYEADHPFERQLTVFKSLGLPYLVAPGTSSWNTIGGRIENARLNIRRALRAAIEFGAQGSLLTDWGDFGHHQSPAISYPGIVWSLCLSWAYEANRALPIAQAINRTFLSGQRLSLAEAILRLGIVHERCAVPMANATILNKLLFADKDNLAELSGKVAPQALQTCIADLRSIADDAPLHGEASLAGQELALAVDLLTYACEKGIRSQQGQPESTRRIQSQVADLAERHGSLWLRRNRPGGLPESKARLLHPAGLAPKVEG